MIFISIFTNVMVSFDTDFSSSLSELSEIVELLKIEDWVMDSREEFMLLDPC